MSSYIIQLNFLVIIDIVFCNNYLFAFNINVLFNKLASFTHFSYYQHCYMVFVSFLTVIDVIFLTNLYLYGRERFKNVLDDETQKKGY